MNEIQHYSSPLAEGILAQKDFLTSHVVDYLYTYDHSRPLTQPQTTRSHHAGGLAFFLEERVVPNGLLWHERKPGFDLHQPQIDIWRELFFRRGISDSPHIIDAAVQVVAEDSVRYAHRLAVYGHLLNMSYRVIDPDFNYPQDSLGDTIETATTYIQHIARANFDFIRKHGDTPMTLIAWKGDTEIGYDEKCLGCTAGRHCDMLNVPTVAESGRLVSRFDAGIIKEYVYKGNLHSRPQEEDILTDWIISTKTGEPKEIIIGVQTTLYDFRRNIHLMAVWAKENKNRPFPL